MLIGLSRWGGGLLCMLLMVTLSVCSVEVYATEAADAWALLQKSAVAARTLSYQGVFICQTAHQTKSVQITHHFDGQSEFSRSLVLDGAPREMLSQSGDLVIYNPKNEKIMIEKRRGQNMFPAMLPANLDVIKNSYILQTGPLERVAGRQAQILQLNPKDGLRYRYQFWVDTESALLLKSVMLNQRDEIMEMFAFNHFSKLDVVALDWFRPSIDHSKRYEMEKSEQLVTGRGEASHWTIKELPAGYRKVDQVVRLVQGKSALVTHVIFSDGLASVSLFIETVPKGVKVQNVLNTNGSTSFYASAHQGYLVTVLGEVPEATVVQIANAIVFNK